MGLLAAAPAPAPGGLPPLTAEQRIRLETADDRRDHQEEAFVALIENARDYRRAETASTAASTAFVATADLDAFDADPDRYRGRVVRLRGRLEQATPLARPFDDIWEWCVRTDGRIALVYLPAAAAITPAPLEDTVEMDGRFYKTIQTPSRAGDVRGYPAFVGAGVVVTPDPRNAGVGAMLVAVLALAAAGLGLAIAVRLAKRSARRPRVTRLVGDDRTPLGGSDAADLPDDPAAALLELRRRSGDDP
ncbi:MAG: hypothetical protein HKO59_00925 [Phycisphaerales bacterium]|nr:hypothetical protein [Phycisphaerales bacterium]NNM24541.1 hypothetical protein [Phycisphaerales bacterium]